MKETEARAAVLAHREYDVRVNLRHNRLCDVEELCESVPRDIRREASIHVLVSVNTVG